MKNKFLIFQFQYTTIVFFELSIALKTMDSSFYMFLNLYYFIINKY